LKGQPVALNRYNARQKILIFIMTRTKCKRDLVDVYFPEAEHIVLVEDDLKSHDPTALYEVFPPAEVKQIVGRLEFHCSPKHASWLNMAEIEFGVLSRQCLARSIPNRRLLIEEVAAWETDRNRSGATVDCRFTTAGARIKLK